MRTLYIDMNSFFASVEQEAEPALRGRPVAITAIESDAGACVAASYEAKAFGIKTGTRIHEAKRLCPHLVLRPSRHKLYVRINQKIAAVIDHLGVCSGSVRNDTLRRHVSGFSTCTRR
ncbi:MAG: hypothetical protein AAFX90_18235 [Pseudomonadota bacterium]